MIIDVHHHFVPKAYIAAVNADPAGMGASPEGEMLQLSWGLRYKVRPYQSDVEGRIRMLDAAQIDVAALSIQPLLTGYNYPPEIGRRVSTVINDALEEIAAHSPGRFVAMGNVPLQDVEAAVAEMEKRPFRAYQILSNVNTRNLDDPALLPFFRAAERLGKFLFVHSGQTNIVGAERMKSYHLKNLIGNGTDTAIGIASLMFGGVLDACPNLKLCFAHAGGSAPYLWGRWEHGQRVRSDAKVRTTTPIAELRRCLNFDSLSHSPSAFRYLVQEVGADHVMLGTDSTADMADMNQVAKIQWSGLAESDVKRILGGNAAALMGL